MKDLLAKDVMQPEVISVHAEDNLKAAFDVFRVNQISGAPVVDGTGSLVGVVSQTDILNFVMFEEQIGKSTNSYYFGDSFWISAISEDSFEKLENASVGQIMSTEVVTVSPEDRVSDIARILRREHIHRVIVAENFQVQGIITSLGLLKIFEQH